MPKHQYRWVRVMPLAGGDNAAIAARCEQLIARCNVVRLLG